METIQNVHGMTHLVLASASPRRLSLLRDMGVHPHHIVAPDVDESEHPDEKPRQAALRLALDKLHKVASDWPDAVILAADTIVYRGRKSLPKAESDTTVADCLRRLSGRRHHVVTALVVQTCDGRVMKRVCDTVVYFRRLTAADIDEYVRLGEGVGKAGGYAIQGRGAAFVRRIDGSYSGVMGLPLFEAAQLLSAAGCLS